MDMTPKSKKVFSRKVMKNDVRTSDSTKTTDASPNIMNSNLQRKHSLGNDDDEYGLNFLPCTQESYEDCDVGWNWNSPHTKPKQKCKQKKFDIESPKIPLKKFPSNNQIPVFDKLKEELAAFKNEIEPVLNKQTNVNGCVSIRKTEDKICPLKDPSIDMNDLFNDTIDEELDLCTQKEEQKYFNDICNKSECLFEDEQNCSPLKSIQRKYLNNEWEETKQANSNKFCADFSSKIDDSFEMALKSFNDENLSLSNQPNSKNTNRYFDVKNGATFDYNSKTNSLVPETCSTKNTLKTENNVVSHVESKNIFEIVHVASKSNSPIKCSPEEIEQKRNEALAKLQAKKKQSIIERNRLEAIKRLEMNKKKRALFVSKGLTNR